MEIAVKILIAIEIIRFFNWFRGLFDYHKLMKLYNEDCEENMFCHQYGECDKCERYNYGR